MVVILGLGVGDDRDNTQERKSVVTLKSELSIPQSLTLQTYLPQLSNSLEPLIFNPASYLCLSQWEFKIRLLNNLICIFLVPKVLRIIFYP